MDKSEKPTTPPPSEPTNLLEQMFQELRTELTASGLTDLGTIPRTATPTFKVNFYPQGATEAHARRTALLNAASESVAPRNTIEVREVRAEVCPSCGTIIDPDGRCRACWGGVMGLCDGCGAILDDGFVCPSCDEDGSDA